MHRFFYILSLFFLTSCVFGPATEDSTEFAGLVLGQSNFEVADTNSGASGSNAAASSLFSPKAVHFDGTKLFVADSSNNRVLIWNSAPTSNKQNADVVIGQTDKLGNTANQGGATGQSTLSNPTAVFSNGTRLFIADTGNNRILIFDTIPTSDNANADRVVGHATFTENEANRLDGDTAGVRADTLNGPTGVYYNGDKLFISDTQNYRVLIFNSLPGTNSGSADVVVGQVDKVTASTSRPLAANSLKKPSGIFAESPADAGVPRLIVSDTGNNRVLIFNSIPDSDNTSANTVIGQTGLTAGGSGTSSSKLSAPEGISHDEGTEQFLIADRGNNRVLIYDSLPGSSGASASRVLGQADFDSSGVNRNEEVDGNTLNQPYGVYTNGSIIWVADTQNARVLRFSAK
ncbi:MAG: hypothetical protein A3B70_03965 [Deltaproteobacteria bacterium RIFCSPHIGHO2_02_FULL_40_11]|nr:MAG: hypothetical protein A3B70_03965 [Deltaproteobacteria bacterium RIFCSPHIGHO2_02_FULL_40_11]